MREEEGGSCHAPAPGTAFHTGCGPMSNLVASGQLDRLVWRPAHCLVALRCSDRLVCSSWVPLDLPPGRLVAIGQYRACRLDGQLRARANGGNEATAYLWD